MKPLFLLYVLLTLSSFSISLNAQDKKAADKLFGNIAGTWRMQTVYDGKKDVTKNDSASVQWMEFREDGRFKSQSGNEPLDSGSYRINENQHSLYLQSDLNKDNPAEWNIEFKENNMILIGKSTPHAQRYKYVYIKTKDMADRPLKPQQ